MTTRPAKKTAFTMMLTLSLVAHLLMLFPVGKYGRYRFALPVMPAGAVMVQLASPVQQQVQPIAKAATVKGRQEREEPAVPKPAVIEEAAPAADVDDIAPSLTPSTVDALKEVTSAPLVSPAPSIIPAKAALRMMKLPPPVRRIEEFTGTGREQLNYQISLYGVPVGTAALEAKAENGDLWITINVKSTPAIASVYPVDDTVEVHHFRGIFIITKIKQMEGGFRGDWGFTLNLREKKVFWMDLLHNRSLLQDLPNDQVLDLISAFYFLRNRPLKVGDTQNVPVYDSEACSLVPVEIVRQEQIRLPGLRRADTVVVKPKLAGGIFKTTGGMTFWFTNDDYKVPVRFETSIPLGTITAELVSSDVEPQRPYAEASADNPPPLH